jgi:tetratricopeptide (TPR) repeat protein
VSIEPDTRITALRQADALLGVRRYAEARELLAQLVASTPDDWRAWCLLAQCLIGLDQPADALEAAQTAIRLQPEQEWGYRLASISARALGQTTHAVGNARRAVELAPHEPSTFVCLTHALISAGDAQGAVVAAEAAIELAPEHVSSLIALGSALAARGSRQPAADAFQRVLARDPDNVVAHNELARMRMHRSSLLPGRLAAAADGFSDALRSDPRAEVSRRNLDLVVRVFLARGAYLLFIVAWIAQWAASDGASETERIVIVALVAVPLLFTVRFVVSVSPPLRRYLLDSIRRERAMAAAILCELVAIGLLIAGVFSRSSVEFVAAAAIAIVARVLLYVNRRQFR